MHVSDAFLLAKKYQQIKLVSFNELINDHNKVIKSICNNLEIKLIKDPDIPSKLNYFTGSKLNVSSIEKEILYNYCFEEILKYQDLPKNIIYL